ncbi:hypothetical protein [Nostoc sp. NMS2]|uniref:hypothetical protein n=1 Tax=Nostoc sp. NMS2 TaxID=2815389 RepID=UPI0025D30302|nr:hypothetical protein [Nostoc sp. NMS2]
MNISDSQKRNLLIISFALVLAWLIYTFVNHKDNFWNLTGLVLGLIGLFFNIEDKRNAKITKAFDDISLAVREMKAELKTEMQGRDSGHDHRLTELTTKVAFVEHKLELHSEQFGHPKMVEELFDFQGICNNKISDLNANVALLTQQGRIAHQLDIVKSDNEKLTELVQSLMAAQPDS